MVNKGVWVIVVAAGEGVRFGGPKQFSALGGRRVLDWSVEVAANEAEGVVVVVAADRVAAVTDDARLDWLLRDRAMPLVTVGGATRSESVRRGLALVPDDAEVVLVHDGARPLAEACVYRRVVTAVRDGAGAAAPVVGVVDAMRWRSGGVIDRDEVVAVQTPQGFRGDVLRDAHASGLEACDDASLAEAAGVEVVLVEGDRSNLKITEPSDLAVAESLLQARDGLDRQSEVSVGFEGSVGSEGSVGFEGSVGVAEVARGGMRVGQGFDVHRYSDDPQKALVLGGVRFPDRRGLQGHSDADVIAHACTDAILAAAGLDDIGGMFPDSDPSLAGADSIELMHRAAVAARAAGWLVVNVSCTVVLDTPRISPRRAEMQECLSRAAGAPVVVTGRRSEGVGALGRGEGVAAWSVALLSAASSWRPSTRRSGCDGGDGFVLAAASLPPSESSGEPSVSGGSGSTAGGSM